MNGRPGHGPGRRRSTALRVFGCEGSTDIVLQALDWALDPNGDGDFSDHLDIINMSLGTDDAPADDPENAVIDELTSHGVLLGRSRPATTATSPTPAASPGNAVSVAGRGQHAWTPSSCATA